MIRIEPINKSWNPGQSYFGSSNYERARQASFEEYIAQEYVDFIKRVVKRQLYEYRWIPLSEGYKNYKLNNGLSVNIWEATGETIGALKVKKGLVVGFDNRRTHSISKLKFIDIARYMEYGTLYMPARPLFRFAYSYIGKHIRDYYDKWMRI